MSYRKGSPNGWREWANWLLEAWAGREDRVSETVFDWDDIQRGTVAERALYAYLLAEAGEPF